MASLSDDDKQKLFDDRAKWAAEDTKAELMGEMAATFQAADVNTDGVLDRAEFTDFMTKMQQNTVARGVPAAPVDDVPEDIQEKLWAFFNAEGAQEGVSLADFGAATGKFGAAVKAAMGQ